MSQDEPGAACTQPPEVARQPRPGAPSIASHAATDEADSALKIAPFTRPNPHFERIGGAAVIARLVERFYYWMDTLDEARGIRALHPPDLAPVKAVLERFLGEWMGGPQRYSAEKGHPRLRRRHLPFHIGPAERDAWMTCMKHAMDEVVADTGLRQQLEQAFFKTADFLRNDEGNSHEHHIR